MNAELNEVVSFLIEFLAIEAYSGQEGSKASFLVDYLAQRDLQPKRNGNNVWCIGSGFDDRKPTVLLNSHIDTVKPHAGYTRNPHRPELEQDRLYALGSTDAGACVGAMIAVFRRLKDTANCKYNLVLLLSAEEENSGSNGITSVWRLLPKIDFAVVGEPTEMQLAVAERGLLVIDAHCRGKGGHAARGEGINAIEMAMRDFEVLQALSWKKVSSFLGPVQHQVTIISGGTQHNVVPADCRYTLDIRVNELYTHEEILTRLQEHLQASLVPRSMNLRASGLSPDHFVFSCAERLGLTCYGSPTLSDMARIPVPAVKMGPGWSGRSHSADEFVMLSEIQQGIDGYTAFLHELNQVI